VKERGIIFSAPMVRALLAGRKTMTRRMVKPQPPSVEAVRSKAGIDFHLFTGHAGRSDFRVAGPVWAVRELMDGREPEWRCPHGQPGDRLWVREGFQYCDEMLDGYTRDAPVCVLFRADMKPYRFEPTARFIPNQHADEWRIGPWKPSIYMPRWASRLTLEVTGVRVERLHEIAPTDVLAEGVGHLYGYTDSEPPIDAVLRFRELWESIHGAGSWAKNPWLWVISFRSLVNEVGS
jgi:hypothetical protein